MATATATRYPFTPQEWLMLKNYERKLHKWAEDECNGFIQYDDNDENPRRYTVDRYGSPTTPGPLVPRHRCQASMVEKARNIAGRHGLSVYNQTDPRGCALYVYSAADLKGRRIDECYSIMATAVV